LNRYERLLRAAQELEDKAREQAAQSDASNGKANPTMVSGA
jgi:hypothetical protein